MDHVSLEELTEARLALEMGALPLVFKRIKTEDLDKLERNLKEVRENIERGVRGKRNLGFHVLLLKASGNQLLSKIAEALMSLMGNLLEEYAYSIERSRDVLKIHEQLIHLLRAKQYSKATQVLEAHINDTFRLFRQHGSNERSRRKKRAEGDRRP